MQDFESKYRPHKHLRMAADKRYDTGREQRKIAPFSLLSKLQDPVTRPDPLGMLAELDKARRPELVPIRYERMSQSPFAFFRGAAGIMASDISHAPRTGINVDLCGDAHLMNFRWYNAPDRRLVFDLNDFDETLPGPFEWDVKRLAASVIVAGRDNGFGPKKCRAAATAAIGSYVEFVTAAAKMSPLDLHYYRLESTDVLNRLERFGKKHRKWKSRVLDKAIKKDSLRALNKLTEIVEGRRIIVADPPLIMRMDDEISAGGRGAAGHFFEHYRATLPHKQRQLIDRFKLVDVASKVVGIGSVGTRCMIMLLESGDGTPLFLQFKQAVRSVLEPYLGQSVFRNSGRRVVEGQQSIQATSDIFLGWARWRTEAGAPIDFYFRQLWDGKGKLDVYQMGPKRLSLFANLCGKALAFAHARSGDPVAIAGYLGDGEAFRSMMVEFAERYADQNDSDYARLVNAIEAGDIVAAPGT